MIRAITSVLVAACMCFCFLNGCGDDGAGPDEETNGGTTTFDSELYRFGTEFNGVWGFSATEAIAVGDGGAILHFKNGVVTPMQSGTSNDLNDIWANSANDIFVVGDGAGGVTDPGVVLHYDGTRWQKMDFSFADDMAGVFGFTHDNVYAVASSGLVVNFNGSIWSSVYMRPGGRSLTDVWGSAPGNVVAVGEAGGIVRWDGGSWSDDSRIGDDFDSVWGAAYNDIYVCGGEQILHYDGRWRVTYTNRGIDLTDIHGSGSGNVWAVGRNNVVVGFDGRGWTQSTAGPNNDFSAVWAYSNVDVVALGEHGSVYQYDGSDWDEINNSEQGDWVDIHGLSASEVYGVLAGAVWKFDGFGWAEEWSMGNATESLWCAPNNEMWACVVGRVPTHHVYHFDGQGWLPEQDVGVGLSDVWGADEANVFVAGENGSVMVRQLDTWTTVQVADPPRGFYGVWGSSASDIFAVGEDGIVYQLESETGRWRQKTVPGGADLLSVWGSSLTHAIAVGHDGAVIKWNGTEWGTETSGVAENLNAVWCDTPDNVWVVGESATVVHFDGDSWRQIETGLPSNVDLEAVWGSGGHDVWIGGENDYLLRVVRR